MYLVILHTITIAGAFVLLIIPNLCGVKDVLISKNNSLKHKKRKKNKGEETPKSKRAFRGSLFAFSIANFTLAADFAAIFFAPFAKRVKDAL